VVDVGILGGPAFSPDITAAKVARAAACRDVDANLDDPAFADAAVATFRALWATRRRGDGADRRAGAVDPAAD
jgi:uncharacterized protein (UPF0261 family)